MMIKIKDLRVKTKEELIKLLSEQKEQLRIIRFDIVLKKIKKVREVRKIRKIIAQILTILNEK